MGTVFTSDSLHNASTNVLGFASRSGVQQTVLEPSPSKVNAPVRKGFEKWMDKSLVYAFVDFKPFRKVNPTYLEYFSMKGHKHSSKHADWTRVFDGDFFIKEMTPSKRIK